MNLAEYLQPYLINVENLTNEKADVVIFGFNKHFKKQNYGSDNGVLVETPFASIEYSELLIESALNPFQIDLIIIKSENIDQVKEAITVKHEDAKANLHHKPIITADYWKGGEVNEIPCNIFVSGKF